MAGLDPTISLKVQAPQIDYIGSITKAQGLLTQQQQMRNLQAQEDATRAGTRVTNIEGDVKERELRAKKWLEQNGHRFGTINARTGERDTNYTALTTEMAAAGFADIAPSIQAAWAQNTAQRIANETNEQTRAQNATKFGREMAQQDAAILRSKTPQEALQQVQRNLNGLRGVAPEAAAAYEALLGESEIGRSVMALYNAPRTAQQQVEEELQRIGLAQSNESIVQAGAASLTSPDARNPGSQVSAQARQQAIAAGLTPAEVNGLSAAQIARLPGMAQIIESGVASPAQRFEAKEQAIDLTASVGLIDQGVAASRTLPPALRTRLGSITEAAYLREVEQNPELARFQAAIDDYNRRNNTDISISKTGFAAVQSRLMADRAKIASQAAGRGAAAASPRIGAPSTGLVRIQAPDGQVRLVPADRADAAIAAGGRRL